MPTISIYTSGLSGSTAITKSTRRMEAILQGHRIEFTSVDITLDNEAKQMLKDNKPEGQLGLKLPQLWVDGQYKCDCDTLIDVNEFEDVKKYLGVE